MPHVDMFAITPYPMAILTTVRQSSRRALRHPSRLSYLKAVAPILISFVLLALSLTCYSLLAQDTSPIKAQNVGWQAWEIIVGKTKAEQSELGESTSLLLDTWDPIAPHSTGLTEIAIKSCLIPPSLAAFCRPKSTAEEDATKGKWVMVTPGLNKRAGYLYVNVWYRRSRRLDVAAISKVRLLPDPPPPGVDLVNWVQAPGDLRSGAWVRQAPLRLWFQSQARHATGETGVVGASTYITELSVLYGDDVPFFGFERVPGGKVTESNSKSWESVDLVYRRGNPSPPKGGPLQFDANGKFKIMQVADLHYSVGEGKCRDTVKEPCSGDHDTATWIGEALEAERPDLVVFSGDQLNGQKTSYDSLSVLAKVAQPVIERHIPWAAVFGNHDSEIADDREAQMRAMMQMPYSLARAGPTGVDGVDDLRIHSSDDSRTHLFTLYFLDSHSYQKSRLPFSWSQEYDYIKTTQIEWFRQVSASVQPIERPHRAEGDDEIDEHERVRLKPNAMMFFHIPLPEAYDPGDATSDPQYPGVMEIGSQLEGKGSSKHNSGFFSQGILASPSHGESDSVPETEVKVLSHGHCHITDRCRRVSGVWICFDGGSSYSGYGSPTFDRRVRIFNISQWGEQVESYKRLVSGATIDHQVLVGRGAPSD